MHVFLAEAVRVNARQLQSARETHSTILMQIFALIAALAYRFARPMQFRQVDQDQIIALTTLRDVGFGGSLAFVLIYGFSHKIYRELQ